MANRNIDLELLRKDLDYLKSGVDEIKLELKCIKLEKISREKFDMVNKTQDDRIKKVETLLFGAIGLTLTTVGKMILDFFIGGNR